MDLLLHIYTLHVIFLALLPNLQHIQKANVECPLRAPNSGHCECIPSPSGATDVQVSKHHGFLCA